MTDPMDKTIERPACMDKDVLYRQAVMTYELAMLSFKDGNHENYRLLMGVAYMLFHLECGKFKITVSEGYDNCGIY